VKVLDEAFALEALGRRGEERRYGVTAEAIRAYAAATDETAPDVCDGAVAPPVFAIVPAWPTIAPASRSVASDAARRRVVHYAHDIRFRRAIEPGMALVSHATPVALAEHPNGSIMVIRTETHTEAGEPVNEQHVTEFFRSIPAPKTVGEPPARHRLAVEGDALAEVTHRIAEDQTERYAAASGDDFAIHLDDEFARAVGLPGRIVHGLCALAFAGRAVLEAAGVDDPRSFERLAVRFSAPLFPGDTLTTRIWRLRDGYGFEAVNAEGTPALKDGLAELA
jgi:acyl dehydratase